MLQQFLIPQLDEDDQEGCIHFQQDGTPPHYLEEVPGYLNTRFPGWWIGRTAPIALPHLPANVAELRTRITDAVAEVMPEMLHSMWQDIDYRCDFCLITNGSHLEP
jgi:hypothetical protein